MRPVNQLMGLVNTHVRTAWETWMDEPLHRSVPKMSKK